MTRTAIEQALQQAAEHHQAGRVADAGALYGQILAKQPNHPDALHRFGVLASQAGQAAMAVELIRRAVANRPNWPEAHNDLGLVHQNAGQLEPAVASLRTAIALRPDYPDALNNLGNTLTDQRNLDEAIAAFLRAIVLKPAFPEAMNNLGNAFALKGQLGEALPAYRRAIEFHPLYGTAWINAGNTLKAAGRINEAVSVYRQAIVVEPGVADAHTNLANALSLAGEWDEAIRLFRHVATLAPGNPSSHNNLANALMQRGELENAITSYRKAIALRPDYPAAYSNLGVALTSSQRFDEAIDACRTAVALAPRLAEAHSNLANALKDHGQLDDAITEYRRALSLQPDLPKTWGNLANALKDSGQLHEAINAYRQAVARHPGDAEAHSDLVYALHFTGGGNEAAADEAQQWNRVHAERLRSQIQRPQNDRTPQRRLRVGYLSPDFRDHVVGRNVLPLVREHDRRNVEVTCYAQVFRPDGLTAEFQRHADRWRHIVGLSDDRVASLIREDQIDILVDLALHTAGNRLLVFARKPAPVQMTFAGYPGGTGLAAIDYRLSDPYLDLGGDDLDLGSSEAGEKTMRLPDSFWCYDPLDCRDILVNRLPALSSGFVTFGCLNNFCKVNGTTLSLWAQVLRRVEKSRLILLAREGGHRQRLLDRLADDGVDPQRIEFVPHQPRRSYLAQYHRIDIGLDTFPYNGHTTSLDSLWMGVPVVTRVGESPVSRAGWCQLSNLSLAELAGRTPGDFTNITVELAQNLPRLDALRSTLRQRMEGSPLMDAKRFARNVEAAYRQIWQRWCAQ